VATYLGRVEALAGDRPAGRVGVAPHSVRAVSRDWLAQIGRYAEEAAMVLHVHACEQRREIEECLAEHGRRPVELLADAGCLGPRTTIVHGTHASDAELDLLSQAGASVCLCPTTEANLGDGYLPALRLYERGIRVCIGTDSNTVIDPVVEVREVEAVARRTAERRNVLVPDGDDGPTDYLLTVGSRFGAEALGLPPPADVELDLSHPSLAGVAERDAAAALIFGGSAAALRPTEDR
jgi:formimidoylglutamate deiminase